MIKIEVIDPLLSIISKKDFKEIKEVLEYEATFWRQGRYHKVEEFYQKAAVPPTIKDPKYTMIYTGHIERILNHCDDHGIECKADWSKVEGEILEPVREPEVPGIDFYESQKRFFKSMNEYRNGIIVSPTRTGKTITMVGFVSQFDNPKVLCIAHTTDLVSQLTEEFKAVFEDTTQIGGGHKWKGHFGHITCSTRQSLIKIPLEKFKDEFDIIFLDECHHLSQFDSQYTKILSKLNAPYRIGFTATIPENQQRILCIEAFIGPLIGELTIEEATEMGILLNPTIKIHKTLSAPRIRTVRSWPEVYERAIIENHDRNRQIVEDARAEVEEGRSVLILVTRREHGANIQRTGVANDFRIHYVNGDTPQAQRDEIKKKMIAKEIMCVICTIVWKEGINIPTLDTVINAGCGKESTLTLQAVGRALTKTEGKTQARIIDYFDPGHHYLISHFGERISLYCENDWL